MAVPLSVQKILNVTEHCEKKKKNNISGNCIRVEGGQELTAS